MKFTITDRNNLCIECDDEEQQQIRELSYEDLQSDQAMYDIFEPLICNSELEWVRPEEVGALTDAPILGIIERNDHDDILKIHHLWWFPRYDTTSPLEDLKDCAMVLFLNGLSYMTNNRDKSNDNTARVSD